MGLLSGAGRALTGVLLSPLTLLRARRIVKDARERYERTESRMNNVRQSFCKQLEKLGENKLAIASSTLPRIEQSFTAVRGNLVFKENHVAKDVARKLEKVDLPELQKVTITAKGIATTAASMAGSSTGMALGACSLVGHFATASTGAAISSLSGAAASNATLAWFGGGAISAGGFGMTGGAIVLGGIALAPIAIIAAFKFASYAEGKLTAAEEYAAQVDIAVEQMEQVIAMTNVLIEHVDHYSTTLIALDKMIRKQSVRLETVVKRNPDSEEVERAWCATVLMLKTIRRFLAINILNKEGLPDKKAENAIEHGQKMLSTANCEHGIVADAVVRGQAPQVPKEEREREHGGVRPGQYSELFFWKDDASLSAKTVAIGCFLIFGILFFPYVFVPVALVSAWWLWRKKKLYG